MFVKGEEGGGGTDLVGKARAAELVEALTTLDNEFELVALNPKVLLWNWL